MTSATEKLRKLLEERGIKWRETINHANCIFTWWESPTFGMVHAMDNEDGETLFMACLNSCDFTPEQAIAATLENDREKRLELLVDQLWYLVNHRSGYGYAAALEAIEELGIEVNE